MASYSVTMKKGRIFWEWSIRGNGRTAVNFLPRLTENSCHRAVDRAIKRLKKFGPPKHFDFDG